MTLGVAETEWSRVLVQWINCLDLAQVTASSIHDVIALLVYDKVVRLIDGLSATEPVNLTQFIHAAYPHFKSNGNEPDHWLLTASLVLFSSIRVQIIQHKMIHLPVETQHSIRNFLTKMIGESTRVTRERVRQIILDEPLPSASDTSQHAASADLSIFFESHHETLIFQHSYNKLKAANLKLIERIAEQDCELQRLQLCIQKMVSQYKQRMVAMNGSTDDTETTSSVSNKEKNVESAIREKMECLVEVSMKVNEAEHISVGRNELTARFDNIHGKLLEHHTQMSEFYEERQIRMLELEEIVDEWKLWTNYLATSTSTKNQNTESAHQSVQFLRDGDDRPSMTDLPCLRRTLILPSPPEFNTLDKSIQSPDLSLPESNDSFESEIIGQLLSENGIRKHQAYQDFSSSFRNVFTSSRIQRNDDDVNLSDKVPIPVANLSQTDMEVTQKMDPACLAELRSVCPILYRFLRGEERENAAPDLASVLLAKTMSMIMQHHVDCFTQPKFADFSSFRAVLKLILLCSDQFSATVQEQMGNTPRSSLSLILDNLMKGKVVILQLQPLEYHLIAQKNKISTTGLSQFIRRVKHGGHIEEQIDLILMSLMNEFPQLAEKLQHSLRRTDGHQKVPLGLVPCSSLPADNAFGDTVVRNIKELVECDDGTATVNLAEHLFVGLAPDFDTRRELFIEQIKQWEVEGNLMQLSGALMYFPNEQCSVTIKVTKNKYTLIGERGAKLDFPEAQFRDAIFKREMTIDGKSMSSMELRTLHYTKQVTPLRQSQNDRGETGDKDQESMNEAREIMNEEGENEESDVRQESENGKEERETNSGEFNAAGPQLRCKRKFKQMDDHILAKKQKTLSSTRHIKKYTCLECQIMVVGTCAFARHMKDMHPKQKKKKAQ